MNAKILILALCAFKLAAGQTNISATLQPLVNQIASNLIPLQTQATAGIQNLQATANAAIQNITSQVEAGLNYSQQYVSTLNIRYEQAEACLIQKATSLLAILNATQDQIQEQIANQTSQIQATSQNFSAVANSLVSQIYSNFTSCLGPTAITQLTNIIPCSAAVSSQVQSAVSSETTLFQSATQAATQLSSFTPISSQLQNIPNQILQVDVRFIQCLQQAVGSNG